MLTKYNKRHISSHVLQGLCIHCGQPSKEFKNKNSSKSYLKTGLCQRCQDLLPKGELNGSADNRTVKKDGKDN